MRLFTAVELGEEVRRRAGMLLDDLRARAKRAAPHARLTWVSPDRMHLTLRFIGEVTDSQGALIVGALRASLPMAPFTIRLHGLGAFPSRGAPRVLWVGVAHGGDSLIHAQDLVSARLEPLGIPREDRPYSPHLTLARVREPAGLKVAPLVDGMDGELGETYVEAITLFQSRLSPKGPTYLALQQTRLSALDSGR